MAVSSGLMNCPFCGGGELSFVRLSTVHGAVCCEDCGARGPSAFYRGDGDGERAPVAQGAWNTRAPSDAALVEALEETATYLEALSDNHLRNDVDMLLDDCEDPRAIAEKLRAALAAAKGQQPALDRNTVNGDEDD